MKRLMTISAGIFVGVFFFTIGQAYAQNSVKLKVKITNITKGVLLTPPIIAVRKKAEALVTHGMPAPVEIEKIAEGGDTSDLAAELLNEGAIVIEHNAPILPGGSVEIEVEASHGYLVIAAMLVPTNDGFVILNNMKISHFFKKKTIFLPAYDAGTEDNDELCINIPGPQCGGTGYVPGGGEGYVYPHPAIHGEADLSAALYNWSDPVAMVSVELIH